MRCETKDTTTVSAENAQARIILRRTGSRLDLELTSATDSAIVFKGDIAGRAAWRRDGFTVSTREWSGASLESDNGSIAWSASLGPLRVLCSVRLLPASVGYQETISLRNDSKEKVHVEDLAFGPTLPVSAPDGRILSECQDDRWTAIPFGKLAGVPRHHKADFSISDLLTFRGAAPRIGEADNPCGKRPADGWFSEGWVRQRGNRSYRIYHFNQQWMNMGRLEPEVTADGVRLGFGGYALWLGGPPGLRLFEPGARFELGTVRYEAAEGGFEDACLAFRRFLAERGCRFPKDFNPPVHWNELFDTDEWHGLSSPNPADRRSPSTRRVTYTRDIMFREAAKAAAYSCAALYLDPGWDTSFGSYEWGSEWLGDLDSFVAALRAEHGLGLALHVCLPTWLCTEAARQSRGVDLSGWPRVAFMTGTDGKTLENRLCPGSNQFTKEAARRLVKLARQGVRFFMFDGNWYPGDCRNADHGHPVPYTYEDHIEANRKLVNLVHQECPEVLIELHPTLNMATHLFTPVYYKYGLPGGHDSVWGYELMWHPLDYLKSGEALALYYHALSCDIPLYLNIDLRDDNEHCLALWWAASTVRHLCVGGVHHQPAVAERQRDALKTYRRLERFYQHGEFLSAGPEIHAHVLPAENSLVVNLFNLTNEERVVAGSFRTAALGIDSDRWYRVCPGFTCEPAAYFAEGQLRVAKRLPPWGCFLYEVTPFETPPMTNAAKSDPHMLPS